MKKDKSQTQVFPSNSIVCLSTESTGVCCVGEGLWVVLQINLLGMIKMSASFLLFLVLLTNLLKQDLGKGRQ